MMYIPRFSALTLLALCGCPQLQTDIAADATSAAAVATAIGRPQDVPCFTAIGAMNTAAKGVKQPAILTDAEIGLGIQSLSQGPCAPIIGTIALTAMRKTPFVGIGVP